MMEITAFTIFIGIFAVADMVSAKTSARLPSLFTIAVISVAGYWSGLLPSDFFALTGISVPLVYVVYYVQLANMGALISLKEMSRQWRTVCIALSGLVGVVIGSLVIAGFFFGREVALVGAPPLAGGIVAYEIMREGAIRIGREDLAIMALAVFVLQGFLGYPLTTFLLKKEGRRLLHNIENGTLTVQNGVENEGVKKLIPPMPTKYNSLSVIFFKIALTGLVGIFITRFINGFFPNHHGDVISRYVVILIIGFALCELGFLDTSPVKKSQIGGFTAVVIIGFSVVAGLAKATPEIVLAMIGPTASVMMAGIVGMMVTASLAGRVLGYSKEMSIAVGLTALYGYPGTEVLSIESVNVVTCDESKRALLTAMILPKMIVAGFTTVTFGSVFLAGILVNFL